MWCRHDVLPFLCVIARSKPATERVGYAERLRHGSAGRALHVQSSVRCYSDAIPAICDFGDSRASTELGTHPHENTWHLTLTARPEWPSDHRAPDRGRCPPSALLSGDQTTLWMSDGPMCAAGRLCVGKGWPGRNARATVGGEQRQLNTDNNPRLGGSLALPKGEFHAH
jgi:hypothetical protein